MWNVSGFKYRDIEEILSKLLSNTYSMTFKLLVPSIYGVPIPVMKRKWPFHRAKTEAFWNVLICSPLKSRSLKPLVFLSFGQQSSMRICWVKQIKGSTNTIFSLLYYICTRPDLLPKVHELTRKMSSPRVVDLQRANRRNLIWQELQVSLWLSVLTIMRRFSDGPTARSIVEKVTVETNMDTGKIFWVAMCKCSVLIAQLSTEAKFYCLIEANPRHIERVYI